MKNRVIPALALLAVLGLMSGCGGSTPSNSPASQEAAAVESTPPATQGTDEGDRDGEGNLTKAFGSTFTWDDGTSVTVTAPKPFKPSAMALEIQQKKELKDYVIMDVTVKNGTKAALNPMMVNIQATTGESDAEAIFDSEQGVDLPSADIMPGQSKKWKAAFAREKGKAFVVQVSNNSTYAANGYYK